ncbi:hypothetical protein K493DRAFT_375631 [Basidiobolus meristosporus CBS 931.73]|uniref:CMP/dCMP-type deaminase domain-containing protein n=1 Tax=Basidiobolus meristosporus CBS 931.73 TaxID=1314790 RepID=A0A1Y1Y574_9FUNG|nr:hypothetical protein K493DRAFT_375631 [Basidiobolus meristosporus CBS 931.73]|eukprot:ORX93143.1 hypothetical protein K493DRAFT_375631 [Basidiobolus meristosporus CBS 931.73]
MSSTSMIGRPRKPIWDHFWRGIRCNKSHYHAHCNYCIKALGIDRVPGILGIPRTMASHLRTCQYAPEEVKRAFTTEVKYGMPNMPAGGLLMRYALPPTPRSLVEAASFDLSPDSFAEEKQSEVKHRRINEPQHMSISGFSSSASSVDISADQINQLIDLALEDSEANRTERFVTLAQANSYVPYSNFKVGAALLTDTNNFYKGEQLRLVVMCHPSSPVSTYARLQCGERFFGSRYLRRKSRILKGFGKLNRFTAFASFQLTGDLLHYKTDGESKFTAIAIATDSQSFIFPCGICRQFMAEWGTDLNVYVVKRDRSTQVLSLEELLPHRYSPRELKPSHRQ